MFGGNLSDNDDFTLSLISNKEVLEVNQNSYNNHEVYNENGIIVWMADIPDSDDKYIGVFNINDSNKNVILEWEKLGLTDKNYSVRNLWKKKDIGSFENSISFEIKEHSAELIRVSKN